MNNVHAAESSDVKVNFGASCHVMKWVDNAFGVTKTSKRQIAQFSIRFRCNYSYVVLDL